MNIAQTPLAGAAAFEEAFAAGLLRLLEDGGLGAFILVLANALTDRAIGERLEKRIAVTYERLELQAAEGRLPQAPADDLEVMHRLFDMSLHALAPARRGEVGPWEIRFNPVRALRPPRMTGAAVSTVRTPFNPDGFHFNKPFLLPERMWSGRLLGREVDLFYNKFPVVEGHLLLIPERSSARSQLLDEETHHFIWNTALALGGTLPGALIGYNAQGAYASVNHLHFHLIRPQAPLPVFDRRWLHNGGEETYPARVLPFSDPDQAWRAVASLHDAERTYNLLYAPGRMLLLPRRFQGSYPLPAWAVGTSWYEIGGGVLAFDEPTFNGMSAAQIESALNEVTLDT